MDLKKDILELCDKIREIADDEVDKSSVSHKDTKSQRISP